MRNLVKGFFNIQITICCWHWKAEIRETQKYIRGECKRNLLYFNFFFHEFILIFRLFQCSLR